MARKPTQKIKSASVLKMVKPAAISFIDFYQEDLPRSLFPLTTNRELIVRGEEKIRKYCENLFSSGESFLPQRRVHANKDRFHLRRTVKLDPVAEFYIYDLVYRNRQRFRKSHSANKKHFGYRFENGRPISPSVSYGEFKTSVLYEGLFEERKFLSFDISAFFNSLYHHDLNSWLDSIEPSKSVDGENFGKYLREINAGRSLDCLPQGIYPAKMIGNDFLRFVEEHCLLRSEYIYRFMDDICLIDESDEVLREDFYEIQKLLGQKGLSINSAKTKSGRAIDFDESSRSISSLKKKLLQKRRQLIVSSYDGDDISDLVVEEEKANPLTEEEMQFAIDLLNSAQIKEEDAELVMIVMRNHANRLTDHLSKLSLEFPHLAKNFYGLCQEHDDKDRVSEIVVECLKQEHFVGEYQLFWFGMMLEKYLMKTKLASEIISLLYTNKNATDITKAKILEIQDARFGLHEMREGFLERFPHELTRRGIPFAVAL